METKYKVIFTGQLRPGFELDDVVSSLISISNMDNEKARKFISAGKPALLKKNIDRKTADKYSAHFRKIGLHTKIAELKDPATPPVPPPLPVQENQKRSEPELSVQRDEPRPNVPPDQPKPKPHTANPYASPKADLKVAQSTKGNWLDVAQKVPASHGWLWVKSAVVMFLAKPWKWMGMALLAMVILMLFSVVPILGSLFNSVLATLLGGGLMLAAQNQTDYGDFEFGYLFRGFSHNRNQLMVVGLLYMAGMFALFAVMIVVVLIFAGTTGLFSMFGSGDVEAIGTAMSQNFVIFILAGLLLMALSIPLIMAFWFATPLVALGNKQAFESYKISLQGCLINWLPFLVYGLVFIGLGIIGLMAMAAISGLLAYTSSGDVSFFFVFLPMIFMFALGLPITVIGGLTAYTSFKDIFYKAT